LDLNIINRAATLAALTATYTYRQFAQMLGSATEESGVGDPWVSRMRSLPTTVVSSMLEEPLDWPDATVARGDAVDVIRRLKQESEVPMRSHGSPSLNHALMAGPPCMSELVLPPRH
jgi:hypothetical protein